MRSNIFGQLLFVATVTVIAMWIYVAITQPAVPANHEKQYRALSDLLNRSGIVPGTIYDVVGTRYVIKDVSISILQNGNTIEIRSEVKK